MPDETDLVIRRSREIRAQAELLIAWSAAVCETSLAIVEHFERSRLRFETAIEPPRRTAQLRDAA